MSRKLRAIVVGAGVIGRVHVDALRLNNVEVASLIASSPARGREAAAELGVARWDPDLETALANTRADAVHIATPNVLHHGMAVAALEAGKHVICEKPLTNTTAEAADLHARTRGSDRVHAVCFNNRFYPLVQEVAARQRAGDLGRIFAIRASVVDDGLWASTDGGWRLDPAVGGESIVTATTGSHLLDLVSLVVGSRVESVSADFATIHPVRTPDGQPAIHVEGEDVAHMLVRFESGARGALALSSVSAGHPYRVRFEIDAENSGVTWDSETASELWIGHRDRPNEVLWPDPRVFSPGALAYADSPGSYRQGFLDSFRLLFRDIYAQIGRDPSDRPTPPFPTFREGYVGMLVQQAVIDSAVGRRWVDVDRGDLV